MGAPFHQLANLFPMMPEADGAALGDDMAANGQRDRIVVLDAQILDGRNRHTQLVSQGVVPDEIPPEGHELWMTRYRRFNPVQDGDPLAFVLSKNKYRRHMSPGQLAMLAADIANLSVGRPKTAETAADNIPPIGGISAETASTMVGATLRQTERAIKVRDDGAPELRDAVRRGDVAVSAAAELATLPVSEQLRILREEHPREFGRAVREERAKTQVVKRERREEREATLGAQQQALPGGKCFGVILADPEWRFETYSRDTGMDRSADNHYPTSTTELIASRPVADIAADDCVLLLWATVPMLPEALQVMTAWGFRYKSQVAWRKAEIVEGSHRSGGLVLGTGYWFRNGHELLLLGTRGSVPAPAMGTQYPSIIDAPPRKHSQKPDFAHEIAEAYFPSLPKIELNARERRAGWDAWGFEAPDVEEIHGQSEAIAMSFADATPILVARYGTIPNEQLAAEIGRPVGTVKTWAFRLKLTDRARLQNNGAHLGAHLKGASTS